MDWDKLRIFYIVAESGSFTRASSRLGISQSAISRQISTLEDRMGVPLFHRHARGLILTEQGELLLNTAREVFSELTMVQARITENIKLTQGSLKIAATVDFGNCWISPRLYKFLDKYPDLRLTLRLSDDPVDLTVHESDVAITTSIKEDDDLIHQELLSCPISLYSSRSYLYEHGVPLNAKDLDKHQIVAFNGNILPFEDTNWILSYDMRPGHKRTPFLVINDLYGIGKALESGCGIACLPPYVAKRCDDLVQILPEIPSPVVQYYFVYSRQLENSVRIKSLLDFFLNESRLDGDA